MKKILIFMGAAIMVVLIGLLIATPISNDIVAEETAKNMADIPVPEKTEYIESASLAGKLVGNGNGMQYFGAILLKSDLSLKQLVDYYEGYSNKSCKYVVEKQKDQNILAIEHKELTFKADIESDRYYIVYAWGDNHNFFDALDIRGH